MHFSYGIFTNITADELKSYVHIISINRLGKKFLIYSLCYLFIIICFVLGFFFLLKRVSKRKLLNKMS